MEKEQVIRVTAQIEEILTPENFTVLEIEIIRAKYLEQQKTVDIRRLSRAHKMPMKHIKKEIEKTDRKLFNLLKHQTEV